MRQKQRKSQYIDFLSAVRRGMSAVVVEQMAAWDFSQESFYDQDHVKQYPFEVALDHQRWKVALDILDHRRSNPNLLAPVPEKDENHPTDEGVVVANTSYERALNLLLMSLREDREGKPLPKPLQERMVPHFVYLKKTYGPEATMARALALGPTWLDWPQRLLTETIDPNHLFVHRIRGNTFQLLELAGRCGFNPLFDQLLQAGANPWYMNHNWDRAAHRIADLKKWPVDQDKTLGVPQIKQVLARRQCLDRLLALEGMDQVLDAQGRTPEQVWENSMEWLSQRPFNATAPASAIAAWHAQRMDLLALPTAKPTAAARHRL